MRLTLLCAFFSLSMNVLGATCDEESTRWSPALEVASRILNASIEAERQARQDFETLLEQDRLSRREKEDYLFYLEDLGRLVRTNTEAVERLRCMTVQAAPEPQPTETSGLFQTQEEVEEVLLDDLEEEDFSILDTKSIMGVVSSILGVLTAALSGIAAISLIVGVIGIMNIMLVSVTERTREIGLRKAVGATPRAILLQFLTEAVVFSVFGGLIGIAIGVGGSLIISHFFSVTVTPWSIALSFGVSSLVGIVFGVAPAAKASKFNPIDALRYAFTGTWAGFDL